MGSLYETMEQDPEHEYADQLQNRCKCSHMKRMKQELTQLKDNPDYKPKEQDLDEFCKLFERYLNTKDKKINWEDIKPPTANRIVKYVDLPEGKSASAMHLLDKLAVLKLNGGLGTTMGCEGPKSAIRVRSGKNFIDLCVKQIEHLNKKHRADVPLVLMNSFNTEKTTQKIIYKYDNIKTFSQSIFPRISEDTLLPICSSYGDAALYPPGHGDLFLSLKSSGTLEELLEQGKEYLFVSNIDNLAATVDFKILEYMAHNNIDFLMEVTEKTRADIKGGTLIEYNGSLRLLEIAQVPSDKKSDFTSVRKFKIFNTNSAWINLRALKELIEVDGLELDIIENKKSIPNTKERVIQLETALGAAIKFFPNAKGVVVPRTRFLPVKTCSDLFLVESDLYLEDHGSLKMNPKRLYPTSPLVKLLGKNFANINNFNKCIKTIPGIHELDHLTVSGNVKFGRDVVLKGTVIIIADEKSSITIPDGAILEDCILYGNLPIIEH